ncbi:MAG: acyl-CoA dehydrogenase family protein, partial [Dehalococcoidia bacterium]
MDFAIPADIQDLLKEIDEFIEREIKPLEQQDDNIRFFDHRREYARTDYENGGVPRRDWEQLLAEMRRRADKAGLLRYPLPKRLGGRDGTNLGMAIIREHLAAKGLGLHNDLQNESSVIGNFPTVKMWETYGTEAQKRQFLDGMFSGETRVAFGLTEPDHGSDATWLETRAVRDGDDWVINGKKRFNSGLHNATHDLIFARTSGEEGKP